MTEKPHQSFAIASDIPFAKMSVGGIYEMDPLKTNFSMQIVEWWNKQHPETLFVVRPNMSTWEILRLA